jgi:hypothetical protein
MLPELSAYERFVYGLPGTFSAIRQSTLVVVRHSAAFAELTGTLFFENEITLEVWEDLDFARGVIAGYSYSVNQRGSRLYWYDPQPHPNDPSLASTHPHHKHIPPDIKHHRIPAPGISFVEPNLPYLIKEIELLLREGNRAAVDDTK